MGSGNGGGVKTAPQFVAAITATLGSFILGNLLGWSSPAGPQWEKGEGLSRPLSSSEISLVSSFCMIGALFGGLTAGYLVDKFGRKWTIIGSSLPCIGGWILLAFSKTVPMLLTGRFITGLCAGIYSMAVPVYISEVCISKYRGLLTGMSIVVLCLGIEFNYVIGSLMLWTTASLVTAVVPGILMLAMFFVPDSPRYMMIQGRRESATRGLAWLRGNPDEKFIEDEMADLAQSVESQQGTGAGGQEESLFQKLNNKKTLKPFGICLTLMFLQQFSGVNAVLFFTVDIFKASGSDIDSNLATMIVGGVQIVMVAIASSLVERLGRKILFFISQVGMTVAHIMMGVSFYLKMKNDDEMPEGLGWLPLLSMVLFIITYNTGCASLPWTYMGELTPLNVKGFASAVATAFCWTLGFIVPFFFGDLREAFGDHWVFWGFGVCCAFGAVFIALVVPETKGKTLDEIQDLF